MTLVEILELLGSLVVIVALAWAAAVLVPPVWSWPLALVIFGLLVLVLSRVVDRTKGGEG